MEQRASRLAIWSLILGVCSLLFLLLCVGPLFAIPAVVCGHMGYSRIGKSAGQLGGQGMALGGLITGYICIGLSVFLLPFLAAIAIPNFVQARDTAQRNACINNLRMISGAKEQWALEQGAEEGTPVTADDIDEYLRDGSAGLVCPAGGTYTFNVIGTDPTCTISNHTSEAFSNR